MASFLDDIPMPTGWEKKFDISSARTYYIDHARKVTQWDDPRLRHPSIWREQQRQMLERLTIIFKDAPEDTLRQALITCRFMEINAMNHVANLGYKKSASVVVGQPVTTAATVEHSTPPTQSSRGPPAPSSSGSKRPSATGMTATTAATATTTSEVRKSSSPRPKASSATSPKPRTRSSSTAAVDPFSLMTMKARYPETAEEVLVDVLNQCGQNIDMASRELTNMGYAGRQRVIERATEREIKMDENDREKKRKQKGDREQNLRQLKNEFESFLDWDIANTYEACAFDLYEARSTLRRREAELKIRALTAIADGPVVVTANVPAAHIEEGIEAATIGDTTVIIERRRASNESNENIMTETLTIKTNKPKKSNMPKMGNTHKMFLTMMGDKEHYQISKSAGPTPSHHTAGTAWESLAKGPDSNLRRGSDSNLRSGTGLARGPDPSLRRGPDAQLRTSFVENATTADT